MRLQEEGKLRELKERWWVEKNEGAGDCGSDTGGGGDAPELGMDNVGGVFLVLGAGVIVSIIVGIIDFMWNIRQIAIDEKVECTQIQFLSSEFPIEFIAFEFTDNAM